jgi:hypothetical protein
MKPAIPLDPIALLRARAAYCREVVKRCERMTANISARDDASVYTMEALASYADKRERFAKMAEDLEAELAKLTQAPTAP